MKVGALYVQRERCWSRPCSGKAYDAHGIIIRTQVGNITYGVNLCLKVEDAHCLEREHTFLLYDGSLVNLTGFLYDTSKCFECIT